LAFVEKEVLQQIVDNILSIKVFMFC